MKKKYWVNPRGVIFFPYLDKKNRYQTVVYNHIQDKLTKIGKLGYFILRIIDENPGIEFENLLVKLKALFEAGTFEADSVGDFLSLMREENVIRCQ